MMHERSALPLCPACGVAAGVAFVGDVAECLACHARIQTLEPASQRTAPRPMAHELPTRRRRPLLRDGDISFKRTR
jgi:hypothetical protein